MITYVDLETARAARGTRLVVSGVVPSPWSEAAKGLLRLAGAPVTAVRVLRADAALHAWTQAHNVPVVMHDDEPPRAVWSQILALADRLSGGRLLPRAVEERCPVVGMIHEIAGEDRMGWCARLLMIEAGLTSDGARGFPLPVSRYLAAKYGYAPGVGEAARDRLRDVAEALARRLGDGAYFGGEQPGALDVYAATFLTPLCDLSEDCPGMMEPLRQAFGVAREELAQWVPAALFSHRRRMLEQHLGYPIQI